MNFEQVIGNRRSIRFFDPDRPVEREKVQKILEAIRLASCAMNAQWIRGVVVWLQIVQEESNDQKNAESNNRDYRHF